LSIDADAMVILDTGPVVVTGVDDVGYVEGEFKDGCHDRNDGDDNANVEAEYGLLVKSTEFDGIGC
jgi:hypothetical protein